MIAGQLKDARRYYGLHPRLQKAFEFLMTEDLAAAAGGRYEIDGKAIFAIVQDYETADPTTLKWEAHDLYLDIQYVASGRERIGIARRDGARVIDPYDRAKDIVFVEPVDGDFLTMGDDRFLLLFPEDAHKVRARTDRPEKVRKVVVKILL